MKNKGILKRYWFIFFIIIKLSVKIKIVLDILFYFLYIVKQLRKHFKERNKK